MTATANVIAFPPARRDATTDQIRTCAGCALKALESSLVELLAGDDALLLDRTPIEEITANVSTAIAALQRQREDAKS